MTQQATCPWSGETFPAKTGKVYASPTHKAECERAGRAYIHHLMEKGLLWEWRRANR